MTPFWILDFGFSIGRFKSAGAFSIALCVMLFALYFPAHAQQLGKIPQIGFLHAGSMSVRLAHIEAFRQGLREHGYIEGKNIAVEYRFAEGRLDRLPELAANLMGLKVDAIAAGTTAAQLAAKRATTTIPIVLVGAPDPVGSALVTSLARPGGNITGLSFLGPELTGKQLELLKETIPGASRIAVLLSGAANPASQIARKEIEGAARALGIQLQAVEVNNAKEVDGAADTITNTRSNGIVMLTSPLFDANIKRIAELATKNRLPSIYGFRDFPEAGGLMSYGTDLADIYRRAATYVDKILKGRNPADLPVEQPTKFELVINLKTAKQIGLTIPPNVLARADRVIR
jgi:putative ABC transport system substrate-binding protein